ncbi:hypothetical protein ABVF54_09950 [Enterococcus mundtii]|uniref:hypothetical protein n=1 Tax=Enterococcus mundtii TaxID=53346 RepID=UPI00336ABF76
MEREEIKKLCKAPLDEFPLHYGYSESADLINIYGQRAPVLANKLIEIIKQEEGLTYAEANASLQVVHERLKFESNFVKLN